MNIEELRELCLNIKGATEYFPFDDVTLVFKVMDKMFAVIPLDAERHSIVLKCDPEIAMELREKYSFVEGAYHFNKKYWNTIYLDGSMGKEEFTRWTQHSVDEVIKKLPKKQQLEYANSQI